MVSIDAIKSAIVDREEDMKNRLRMENVVRRECMDEVKNLVGRDYALIITGPRRCGKSFLAWMINEGGKYGYVNFEDERLTMKGEELNRVLEAIYSLKGDVNVLIFDEIQNVDGWERFVSRVIINKKVIITGSNARLMSRELATHLTGRHVDFTLFPFSFREYLDYRGFKGSIYLTKDAAKLRDMLSEYMRLGGFPLAYTLGRVFLAENYKDIVERDIVQRYGIRYVSTLKSLARYMMSNVGKEISFNKIKNVLDVKSPHTIKKYAGYLENAYLLFFLNRFSYRLKEQIIAPKKVYAIDTGMTNTIGYKISENLGRTMENIVAIELMRRKSYWHREWEIYYWKDHQQREVDFVVKEGEKVRELIQVTYASGKDEIERRELRALEKASEELICKNKTVITWDYEEDGEVRLVPLWKWLLNNPY